LSRVPLKYLSVPALVFLSALAALFITCGKAPQKKPNIILITLDTTRADHLGCYGYSRLTSPNLDSFARQAVLYTKCISTSSWTLPAHASLFTGKFTSSHGVRHHPKGPLFLADAVDEGRDRIKIRARGMSAYETTLAEILKSEGYQTAGIAGGPWMKRIFGLDKGFDFYDDDQILRSGGRSADLVNECAFGWLDQVRKEPFFLFINYFDPHYPFQPPEEYADIFAKRDRSVPLAKQPREIKIALYDAEIVFMDVFLGRLFDKLKTDGLFDNTMIVITADHGELLGEDYKWGHGKYLTQEEIYIPLIVKYPSDLVPAGRSDQYIQLVDVFAMILHQLEIPFPENIQGEAPPAITHPIISETYPLKKQALRSIIEGEYKLVWHDGGIQELFNIVKDPEENRNLVTEDPRLRRKLLNTLETYITSLPSTTPSSPEKTVDKKTRDALKSLGYLQ